MALSRTVLLSTLTVSANAQHFPPFGPSPDPTEAPETAPTATPAPVSTTAPQTTPAPAPDPTPANETTTPPPMPSDGGKIQSRVSSFCMDLPGGDTANGKHLWMWECYDGVFQNWIFEDGQLKYARDKTKCVDLLGGDATNGNPIAIWDCYPGDSQQWGYDADWGTIYLTSSTASDATKCMQIGGAEKGDPLVIWDCTIQPYQIWDVGSVNATQSSMLSQAPETTSAPTPGLDPTTAPQTPPAPAPDPTPANETTTPPPMPSDGGKIQSRVSSFCMDLPGGDTANGKHLWMWECNDGVFQNWIFEDGQLKYARDKTKCVDMLGQAPTNGNPIGIWDCYPGDSQQWGYDSDWGTIYLTSSTASDATKCMQIGGAEKGDPLVIWDCTIQPYQIWDVNETQSSIAVV